MSDKYDSYDAAQQRDMEDAVERALRDVAEDNMIVYQTDEEFWKSLEKGETMFDDIEEDIGKFGWNNFYPLGIFIVKVEMGNNAMQNPDDLANALELIAIQVRNRMEYPQPILDANGNTCGDWRIHPYDAQR